MSFRDFLLLSWIFDNDKEENTRHETSIIMNIISFILLYFPIILLTSLIITILKIDNYSFVFKIVTIIYSILFLIFVVTDMILRFKKLKK